MTGHEFFQVLIREHNGPSFCQAAHDRLPQVFQRRGRPAEIVYGENGDAKVLNRACGRFIPGRSIDPRASPETDQARQKESDDAVI